MDNNYITISELSKYIKSNFDNDAYLRKVFIKGEISNFKLHSSGHIYLTLKDETGVLKSVMFRAYASRLNFVPENGMKVLGLYIPEFKNLISFHLHVDIWKGNYRKGVCGGRLCG